MRIFIVKSYNGLYNGVDTAAFSTLEKAKEYIATDCERMASDWAIVEKEIDNPSCVNCVVILKTDKKK